MNSRVSRLVAECLSSLLSYGQQSGGPGLQVYPQYLEDGLHLGECSLNKLVEEPMK